MQENDHQLAARLATEAGALLLDVRTELVDAEPSVRKDEGDRQAHEFLMSALQAARPDDAVLSEEGKDDLARLDAERTWIVDPLDGTREFGEIPRTDWAVHVALVVGGVPIAGAVALPGLDVTLATPAAELPSLAELPAAPRVIASRTRPGPAAEAVAVPSPSTAASIGATPICAYPTAKRGQASMFTTTPSTGAT